MCGSRCQLHRQSTPADEQRKDKRESKTKFTCPQCGQHAWAKPDATLTCGVCASELKEIKVMLAELREAT